jgi:hypothetical protein
MAVSPGSGFAGKPGMCAGNGAMTAVMLSEAGLIRP